MYHQSNNLKKTIGLLILSLIICSLFTLFFSKVYGLTDSLWVNSWSNARLGWTRSGSSPYLDDSASEIYTKLHLQTEGDFGFEDLGSASSINSVIAYFECSADDAPTGEYFNAYFYDGSGWSSAYTIYPSSTTYKYETVDISGFLNTVAKVQNAQLYVEFFKLGGADEVYIRRCYLYVDYNFVANDPPENIEAEITDFDDSDNLYSERKFYNLFYSGRDLNGFADIDYVLVNITQDVTLRMCVKFDEDTNVFSLIFGDWELDSGSSTYNKNGNWLNLTFKITPSWDAIEESDFEIKATIFDDEPSSDSDTLQTDYGDVIITLVTNSIECEDINDPDRVNVGISETTNFGVRYADNPGSSTPSLFYPQNTEFNSISIYDSLNNNKGSDNSIVDGDGSVSFSESVVKSETYNLYVDLDDTDWIDKELTDKTETIIWDRILFYYFENNETDKRCNINQNIELRVRGLLEYDNHLLGVGDSVEVNSSSLSWDAVNLWFDEIFTEGVVGNYTYIINLGNEVTYGITVFNQNVSHQYNIFDKIVFLVGSLEVDDPRINFDSNGLWYVELAYDYDNIEVDDGNVNLNVGSMSWSVGNDRWEYQFSLGSVGSTSRNITALSGNLYGITILDSSILTDTEEIIFDRIDFLYASLEVDDPRIDFDSNGLWYAELKYEYDGVEVDDGNVNLNVGSMSWSVGNDRWEYQFSLGSVGSTSRNIDSVSGNLHGITALNIIVTSDSETIIFDRILFYYFENNETDKRCNINQNIELRVRGLLEYDNHLLGVGDSVEVNSSSLSWDAVNLWFDEIFTESIVGNYTFIITLGNEVTYGITSYTQNISNPYNVFDRINVDWIVDEEYPDNNQQVNFTVYLDREFDNSKLTLFSFDVLRNSSLWLNDINTNFTDTNFDVKYNYTIVEVIDNTYGLTIYTLNVTTYNVTWGALIITIKHISLVANDTDVFDYENFELNITIEIKPDSDIVFNNTLFIDYTGLNISINYLNGTGFSELYDPSNFINLNIIGCYKNNINSTWLSLIYNLYIRETITKEGWFDIRAYTVGSDDKDDYNNVFNLTIRGPVSPPSLLFGAGFNSSNPFIEIYWNPGSLVTDYELQNSTDTISWSILSFPISTSYNDTSSELNNGTYRYYRVRSRRFTGVGYKNSTWSNINLEKVYFLRVGGPGPGISQGGGIGWVIGGWILLPPILLVLSTFLKRGKRK